MEESRSVAEVAQRLREIEDHNIAFRLQEEEFKRHYNRNREDRRLVREDTKKSIEEQMKEDEAARQLKLEENMRIAESDEELARRLQREFDEEFQRQAEAQDRSDAELARRLATLGENQSPSSSLLRTDLPPTFESQPASKQSPSVQTDIPLIDTCGAEPTMAFDLPPPSNVALGKRI